MLIELTLLKQPLVYANRVEDVAAHGDQRKFFLLNKFFHADGAVLNFIDITGFCVLHFFQHGKKVESI